MAKTVLEPAGDRVLVVDVIRTTTIDGIELPENTRQKEMVYGYAVSVGPLAQERVKEGDRVCYGPYAGKPAVVEGVEFRLIREGHIEGFFADKGIIYG